MDDDDPPYEKKAARSPSAARMSKVPSWVSVGFVLGLFAGWTLKPEPPVTSAPPPKVVEVMRPAPQETKLTTIEAVFAAWEAHAVWDEETTEIAYWNPGTENFTEFYEVRRVDGALYFRSIPRLTRRLINHGRPMPPECPLRFTETEEQYREWREHGRYERPAPPANEK